MKLLVQLVVSVLVCFGSLVETLRTNQQLEQVCVQYKDSCDSRKPATPLYEKPSPEEHETEDNEENSFGVKSLKADYHESKVNNKENTDGDDKGDTTDIHQEAHGDENLASHDDKQQEKTDGSEQNTPDGDNKQRQNELHDEPVKGVEDPIDNVPNGGLNDPNSARQQVQNELKAMDITKEGEPNVVGADSSSSDKQEGEKQDEDQGEGEQQKGEQGGTPSNTKATEGDSDADVDNDDDAAASDDEGDDDKDDNSGDGDGKHEEKGRYTGDDFENDKNPESAAHFPDDFHIEEFHPKPVGKIDKNAEPITPKLADKAANNTQSIKLVAGFTLKPPYSYYINKMDPTVGIDGFSVRLFQIITSSALLEVDNGDGELLQYVPKGLEEPQALLNSISDANKDIQIDDHAATSEPEDDTAEDEDLEEQDEGMMSFLERTATSLYSKLQNQLMNNQNHDHDQNSKKTAKEDTETEIESMLIEQTMLAKNNSYNAYYHGKIPRVYSFDVKYRQSDMKNLVRELEDGKIDIIITAVSPNAPFSNDIRFSQSFWFSGARVMVRDSVGSYNAVTIPSLLASFISVLPDVMVALGCMTVLYWMLEKEDEPCENGEKQEDNRIHERVDHGLADSFYFSVVSLTSVGYGDFYPKTRKGKILVFLWMFASIFIMSYLLGHIFSNAFTEQSHGRAIDDLSDLKGSTVGVVAMTQSEAAVKQSGVEFEEVKSYKDYHSAVVGLVTKEVEVVVGNGDVLTYFSNTVKFRSAVKMCGLEFAWSPYAFAFSKSVSQDVVNYLSTMIMEVQSSSSMDILVKQYLSGNVQ